MSRSNNGSSSKTEGQSGVTVISFEKCKRTSLVSFRVRELRCFGRRVLGTNNKIRTRVQETPGRTYTVGGGLPTLNNHGLFDDSWMDRSQYTSTQDESGFGVPSSG